jgi:ribosomal-protein-alanine N-acetyltransferase
MIITNRLTIRKEKVGDAPGIQEMLMDPDVRTFQGGIINKTIKEIEQLVCKNLDAFSLNMSEVKTGNKRCVFNVERNDNGNFIGYCGFKYCEIIKDIEICYSFTKKNWNMGYGTEAALAVLDFGFSQTNLEKVFAAVNPLNIASEKILIGIGMIYRKKIEWPDQGFVNLYSLNKGEYKKIGVKKFGSTAVPVLRVEK